MKLVAHIDSYYHSDSNKPLFRGLAFEVREGSILGLLGPSGSGKTSLLQILLGIQNGRLIGEIEYYHQARSMSALDARNFGLVGFFSSAMGLAPWLSIKKNIMLPGELNPSLPRPSIEQVKKLLDEAELDPHVLEILPYQLSFGMLQRVCLVRTLVYSPRFLLLDETFTGLDPVTTEQIGTLLDRYISKNKAICILVTHDYHIASKLSDNFVVIGPEAKSITMTGERLESELRDVLFTLCSRS
jgi:ABC-type nitrate/sulfonate/bicarbonate transport system ATPase subunit